MIINAESLLPHLREKVRPTKSDTSRHLLCPFCETRTKLTTLGDGRRKCTVCGKKFRIHKSTEGTKVQQCAEILLCFCVDFSAHRTAQITHHRYRLVAVYYDHFRTLIAEKSLSNETMTLLEGLRERSRKPADGSHCRWCKTKLRAGTEATPVFGIQLQQSGDVSIDPLSDNESAKHWLVAASRYAGFLCCGKLHRLPSEPKEKDALQEAWTWMQEQMKSRHGFWTKNTGVYLQELEWKFNHRALDPEAQAKKIIEWMPMNFLTSWALTAGQTTAIQTPA